MSETSAATGWKKPILVVLATAPIALIAFAFVFMAQSEIAFDEDRCPYQASDERIVRDGVSVREERRSCQDGVEERRWTLYREGQSPLELGRRRLESHYFGEGYSWSAAELEGRVRIEIRTPGQEPRAFREPPADSGLR